MKTLDFVVKELPEDPRLDKVIPLHVKELSRAQSRRLIEGGGVYLNRKRCQMNGKTVKLGDKVRIVQSEVAEGPEYVFVEEAILYENEDFIVVNKPPRLPTHETIDNSRHHLVRALQAFLAQRDGKAPGQVYLGIHHRLDRDTSGALLFTKRREANAPVAQAFQDRRVKKTYLALCAGRLAAPRVIKSFLGSSPRNKRFYATVARGGKYAETEVRSVATRTIVGQPVSLIEACPKTGRTHQIRVHLAENGLPILGDKAYGREFAGVDRVMLHAWKLSLLGHTFHAPLPEDFRRLDFPEPRE
jgi:23S rRNA pseudouridine1911/1915/1917 synthase